MGPPLRNLSINQLLPSTPPLVFSSAVGEGLVAGAGLSVAPGAAGEAAAPGGAGAAGPPGGALEAGSCAGAAGFATAPGLPAGAGAPGAGPAGDVCGGAGGGGFCASEVNASANEHRQALINVFIIEAGFWWPARLRHEFLIIANGLIASRAKLFTFFSGHFAFTKVAFLIRIICTGGM